MNFVMESILARVPDYQEFYTVDELNQHSFQLAKEYPDVVELFSEAGRSKEGRPIYCLKIGQGSKNALLYGTPHPNEPIGSMMLDALSRILAEDEQLRKELDYTFYIVKSSDVDGLAKNEGWLKGPFTITQYQHNFFRPAFDQQVEWSFPFDYKTYPLRRPHPRDPVHHGPHRQDPARLHLLAAQLRLRRLLPGISPAATRSCIRSSSPCPPNTAWT